MIVASSKPFQEIKQMLAGFQKGVRIGVWFLCDDMPYGRRKTGD